MFKNLKTLFASVALVSFIAPSLAFATLNLPVQNCSYVFNTNMALGSRGEDVKNLQTVLNMFPQTIVAPPGSGVGAKGMESTIFDQATQNAVSRFQNMHLLDLGATNITPMAEISGSGYVGPITRSLLNQICVGSTATTQTSSQAFLSSAKGFGNQTISPNTSNVKIGSFTVTAGSEGIRVKRFDVVLDSNQITNYYSLVLKYEGVATGTPIGIPVLGMNSFAFPPIDISSGQSKTFDVYVDVGSSVSKYVSVNAGINYTMSVSGTETSLKANGVTTTSLAATVPTQNGFTTSCTRSFFGRTQCVNVPINPVVPSPTFARTAGFTETTVNPNTINVKIGSFTVTAGSSDVKVATTTVLLAVSNAGTGSANALTNYSNLTLKTGTAILGTPVGNPIATTTFSFVPITIPAKTTKTFDVYADINNGVGSVNASMKVDYIIPTQGTTGSLNATGVNIRSANGTLANPTLSPASPVSQFVVGGSTMGIATFKLKTGTVGTTANIIGLEFSYTGKDAIESAMINGVSGSVMPSSNGGKIIFPGRILNILTNSNGVDVPVTVKFAGFQGSTTGGSLTSGVSNVGITLTAVNYSLGSGGATVVNTTPVSSNKMTLVASKPIVTMSSGNTSPLILGVENKIGEFTVTADANGNIAVSELSFSLSAVGVNSLEFRTGRITDAGTTIPGTTVTGSSTMNIKFATPYEITAGTSKTFSLIALVAGENTPNVSQHYVVSRLTSPASFKWFDVLGGNTQYTGSGIFNFPTGSYTTLSSLTNTNSLAKTNDLIKSTMGSVLSYVTNPNNANAEALNNTNTQTVTTSRSNLKNNTCINLTNHLSLREYDNNTDGEVSKLQNFLKTNGYYNNEITGYLGTATEQAIKDFQSANNLVVTGIVGAETRAVINKVSCGL